jgi:nitrite reductase/ring-hydroxylating ferredoxin subunit
MSGEFVKIGSLNNFPEGSKMKVHVNGEDVLVANLSGKIYAIGNTCTHRSCSLSDGEIEDTTIICPCHHGRFEIATGKVIGPPPKIDVAVYEVQLQGSDVLVRKRSLF